MKKVILATTLAVILVVGIGAVAIAATPPDDSPKGIWETINNKIDIVLGALDNMWDTKSEQSDSVDWDSSTSGSMGWIFSPENGKSHISMTIGVDNVTAGDTVKIMVKLDSDEMYTLATIDADGAYSFEFDAHYAQLNVKNDDSSEPLHVEYVATINHY